MLVGAMNHPAFDVTDEIGWMGGMGLDFLDFTAEPPKAARWQVDPAKVVEALRLNRLKVVGHTAYYLPLASPFEELRRQAVKECIACLELFADIGAEWMNIHPDNKSPLHPREYYFERNLLSLEEMLVHARRLGIGVMVENIPGEIFNSADDLGALLGRLPELGLHLDVGHAHLSRIPHNAERILDALGHRLKHVHLHDNRGGTDDLHLPLGTGTVDVAAAVQAMKRVGYDGTITLEVFSGDREYLAHSRDVLREFWNKYCGARVPNGVPVDSHPKN